MILPEGKRVERLSVSQIETFDPDSTWGCPSKWWFKYVAGLKEPEDASKSAGTAMHRRIETYLRADRFLRGHPLFLEGRKSMVRRAARGDHLQALELAGKGYIDEIQGRLLGIEHHFDGQLSAHGIPLVGYIDALMSDEVRDWKSTSDIGRYAKTETEMSRSIQMTGYSKYFFDTFPHLNALINTHVYFQTRGKKRAEKVSCQVTRDAVDVRWTTILETVRVLTETARETNSDHVEKDTSKCHMGRSGCPYLSICQPRKGVTMAQSLLDIFGVPDHPATAGEAAAQPSHAVSTETGAATPGVPGAASPAPAVASSTAQGPAGVATAQSTASSPGPESGKPAPVAQPAEEKKPRGRPPKGDTETVAVRVKSITVRHGLKINLGNYQTADVSVEFGAEVSGGSVEIARQMISEEVQKALTIECQPYRTAVAKEKT